MSNVVVTPIPCLTDNYAYLIERNGNAVVIDPSESDAVVKVVEERKVKLTQIWNTHHHWDHVGGNRDLKNRYGCQVIGSWIDRYRVPEVDSTYEDNQAFLFEGLTVQILAVPGHTIGAIAFYLPEINAVFTGDTLFILGCGRLFEGTSQQMWESLKRLSALPPDTLVYCGHEYFRQNAEFARAVNPHDDRMMERITDIEARVNAMHYSVPGTIGTENNSNPFLTAGSADRFAELRKIKDSFKK